MTRPLVSALTLPKLPTNRPLGTRAGRQRLTMPNLPDRRTYSMVYDFAAIDQWGRVIARAAVEALGWQPGTRLSYMEKAGLILVVGDEDGTSVVDKQGHLRLPFPVRQWCRLDPGTRMLVVGDPAGQRLVMYLPVALDDMIVRTCADVLGGGVA